MRNALVLSPDMEIMLSKVSSTFCIAITGSLLNERLFAAPIVTK